VKQHLYEETRKSQRPVSAESIARQADNGRDVSRFFTAARERFVKEPGSSRAARAEALTTFAD
jgi:hypothetical protein